MDTEVLAQLINAKFQLLSQLQQLATRQAAVVAGDDMSRMIQLLAVKQKLLNTLDELERRLDPFRDQDPDRRVWSTPARREQVREVSAQCDKLLREIMSIERGCESQLIHRRDQAADELHGVHLSAQVVSEYQGAVDSSGRQFDASCET